MALHLRRDGRSPGRASRFRQSRRFRGAVAAIAFTFLPPFAHAAFPRSSATMAALTSAPLLYSTGADLIRSAMTQSYSHAHPYHVRGTQGRHSDVLSGRLAGHLNARLRLYYVGSPSPARRTEFNACTLASLGLRTPLRLLPTLPLGNAVAFGFPLFPHHHRTWTFTSFRHDLRLARSRSVVDLRKCGEKRTDPGGGMALR